MKWLAIPWKDHEKQIADYNLEGDSKEYQMDRQKTKQVEKQAHYVGNQIWYLIGRYT